MKLMPLVLVLITLPVAADQFYRWVDGQGRVNYSDQPPPSSMAKQATQKSYKGSVIEGGESYALRQARERFPVTLFATTDCGIPCEQAKGHLARRGIPYSSKDPSSDAEAQKALAAAGGKFRVPTLLVGTDKLEGYEEGAWNASLDRAGYPKSPAPGAKAAAKTEENKTSGAQPTASNP
jgi:glutaredoxin